MSEEDSGYLRLLSDGLNREAVSYVMDEAGKPHKVKMRALVIAILRANTEKFEEVMAMGGKTLEEVLEQLGLTAKWEARAEERNKAKIEKIARNLIKKGLRCEEIAEMTELDLTDVLSLREQCKT